MLFCEPQSNRAQNSSNTKDLPTMPASHLRQTGGLRARFTHYACCSRASGEAAGGKAGGEVVGGALKIAGAGLSDWPAQDRFSGADSSGAMFRDPSWLTCAHRGQQCDGTASQCDGTASAQYRAVRLCRPTSQSVPLSHSCAANAARVLDDSCRREDKEVV